MSTSDSVNNKRIAKNTLLLYFRMIFWVAVSLYTNRVVLDQLGASDFGIFNVVFGFVTIVSFLPASMSAAVGRFLNVGLGMGQTDRMKSIFQATVVACAMLALVVLILFETVGVWFATSQLNYPPDRATAVMLVYQLCVANMVIGLFFSPFQSLTLSHERMGVYALFSILDASVKLFFVLALPYLPVDKLVAYMICIFGIGVMLDLCYLFYCRRHFEESRSISLHPDFAIIREVVGYCSWNTLQVLTFVLHTQCIAVLVNLFFGTVMNAAYGIALQISNVLKNFVKSFTMAAVPQIMKSHSAGAKDEMSRLIDRSCRLSIVLVVLIVVPMLLQTPFILSLWLKQIPPQTILLVRVILLVAMADACSDLFTAAVGATGKIRNFNLATICCGILHAVVTWLMFRQGMPPVSALWAYLAIIVLENVVRITYVVRLVDVPVRGFVLIALRAVLFIVLSIAIPHGIQQMFVPSTSVSLAVIVLSVFSTLCLAVTLMFSVGQVLEYVKHTLRSNSFYKRHFQGRVNSLRYFVKDLKLYVRNYTWMKDREVEGNTVYFIFDPAQKHPGMTDRIKVIVCCYWIAKQNDFDFKVIYDQPHRLADYLAENEARWEADRSELSYSLRNSRLLSYNGSRPMPRLSKCVKQYHIYHYIGINLLINNHIPDASRIWSECFNELFKPSARLAEAYMETGLVPRQYAAVHLRFVNALEHFEDGFFNSIPPEQQQRLVERSLAALADIRLQCQDLPLYVFSDSNRFLNIAREAGYLTLDGQIGHISFTNDRDALIKAFLDSYAISQSASTYRVLGGHLYESTFPYYAALMGGKECINYKI